MDFQKTERYIDQKLNASIEELAELVAQPGISAKRTGLEECAAVVIRQLEKRKFQIQKIENDGAPIIVAERKGKVDKTLLFYNHYDVQPVEPLRLWKTSPFELSRKDGKVYGRGTNDDKGNITNRLLAVDALLDAEGELPCNVKFVIEGEEETSSENFAKFVDTHADMLQADACIWEFGEVDQNDQPLAFLGLRGICYVDVEVVTAKRDVHSGIGGSIIPNAAWRLIWALNTLKSPDESINLPGFYDDVVLPSPRDIEYMRVLQDNAADYKKRFGVSEFLHGIEGGVDLQIAEVFQPTCTICGLNSGYHGPGTKTIVPAKASAKIDFRLVPNQKPEKVVQQLRQHLDAHSFEDVIITNVSADGPARTDPDDAFIQMVVHTAEDVYGMPMKIVPMTGGSGPNAIIQNALQIPIATVGIGYPGSRDHAPNENVRLDLYAKAAKHLTRVMHALAEL